MLMRTERVGDAIEIRLRAIGQLFETLDPSPFRGAVLTPEAETYFMQRVKELPKNEPVRIVLHLPADEAVQHPPFDIVAAMTRHFADRAAMESKRIQELFRNGRRAAMIGFVVWSVCLFLAWHIPDLFPVRPLTHIVQQSFVILGWVAMWKPVEIILYDWLSPRRRQRVLERLAAADVSVRS